MAVLRTKPVGYASFAALVLFFCLIGPLAYADNLPPLPPSIAPSNGTSNFNQQVIFNTIYSDPDGYSNIQYAQLIINLSVTGANGFLGYYIQATNKLYLMNDDGTSWQGGFVPGSSNTIENSYCKLDCSKTTVSGSGNAFTINWAITFKAAFIGSKNIYLFVRDNSAAFYGWMYAGTWAIVNQPPMVISISPSNSVSNPNQEVLFTTVYSDQNGCSDIQYVHLLINASISGSSGFLGYYIQATNKIYIMNDSGSSWLGGYAPGSTNVIENSYCKLDYSKTTVSGSGNNLTVSWSLTFKSSFQGVKNTYLFVRDNLGAYYGWAFGGTWRINQAPSIVSFLPSSGSSNSDQQVIFSTTFSDPDGWQDIQYAHLLINTSISGSKGFLGYYIRATNMLYLMDDEQTVWLGGYTPGSSETIENSYVELDCSKTTVSGSGNNLSINWALSFKEPFIGTKNSYLFARDNFGALCGWAQMGSWKINFVPKERVFIYLNGQRVAMEENGKKYFYHNDHLGGTNIVTDESGQQVKYIDYKPYGETKTEEGSLSSKKKFTGKELDDSTGLYDYSARMYDAKTGRFISPDPTIPKLSNPQSLNRYSYCLNNPLKYVDPTGHVADYAMDAFFFGLDLEAYQQNPSFLNAAALGIDAVLAVTPLVPAVGGLSIRALSNLNKAEDAVRASKEIENTENAVRGIASLEKAENLKNISSKTFRHYGYAKDAENFENGLEKGAYATHSRGRPMKGSTAEQKLSLEHEQPPDCYYKVRPENATPVDGPFKVEPIPGRTGGGEEYRFPEGTGKGTVTGPYKIEQ